MAEIANTLWYRLGTVTATDGSTKITGVGTHFTTAGINPGATLRIDGRPYAYEVKKIISDTEIELAKPYYGGTVSSASYSIDRNFQSTTNANISARVSALIGIYEQVREGTIRTIEGKSAYQIAVDNGFVGTEEEWLESLKGNAEEIAEINTKLDKIYTNNAAAHNSVYRGKNLGSALTAEQSAAIRNGTYDDIYPGDYWSAYVPPYSWTDSDGEVHEETGIPYDLQWLVLGCNSFKLKPDNVHSVAGNHVVVWPRTSIFMGSMNKTATTEGGYVESDGYKNKMLHLAAIIKAVFGEDHIMPHWDSFCNSVTDGEESGWRYVENRLCDLLSEEMVFGQSFHKPIRHHNFGRHQFPAFALNADWVVAGGTNFWLRDVASDSHFSCVSYNGGIAAARADNEIYTGFRPFCLLH